MDVRREVYQMQGTKLSTQRMAAADRLSARWPLGDRHQK